MPVVGGFIQPRGGLSRHDAVNWAFARAAGASGVDLIQNCEALKFERSGGPHGYHHQPRHNECGKNCARGDRSLLAACRSRRTSLAAGEHDPASNGD
jgi:hypothetical protein